MPKYKPLYSLYKGLRENKYDVPDSYVSFQKTLTQPGNAGAKSRRGLYQSLKDNNYDVPDTYEDFYKNLFVPVNSTTSRALKIGENPNTPTVNRYRQKMFNSVDPNKSRASELTHRAIGQAVRATNNVRKPVVAKVVNRKGKLTGEKFAITPAKTVEDLDREYAQETTKNWENELNDQMADADKDAAKISDMFKSFIGSTDEVGSVWGNMTRGGGIAGTPHSVTTNNGILENTEARQLLAAGDYNRKRRELLQLEKDSRNGAIFDNHSFFRGMYDAAKDTGFLTGGASDLINAGSLLTTKQDLDNGVHTEAGDMLMQQAIKNSNAQSQYGDNQGWMYTGGVITTNMAPFMVQIGSAGFSKGMSNTIGKVVQGAASKVALGTMEKATGMVGAHIANYIGKVTGLTTKAFGKAIQYGIVGAAQANTVGLGNVANDVINRYTGQVYQDEQGNYKFGTFDSDGKLVHEGGEDFLTSLVKGEAAQTIEFATELAGGGIDAAGTALKNFVTKGGKKIINKYNMENVSKVIDFLLNNKVSKNARYLKAGADRTLGKVEVNSIVGESLEEELGIIANTVFTGDNKISDLWDDKQQSQIWGGMLLSIGLMKGVVAPFHAYNAKQYYSYKHKLDKADVNLSQLLGKEKWEELRNQIDATTNEDMPEMVNKINRDVALGKNRQPVREYIQNLLIMRGYDIGNMLAAKKAVEDKGKGVSVKNMEKNQAYQQGRDAYGYDTHEIQLDQADKQKTLAQLLGITEQQLSTMSDEELDNLSGRDEELDNLSGRDDNLDKAIYDYQLSTIRYQGVADNAQDQVDLAAQKAAQAVDMYTDKSRNTIRNATIKATGGLEDYGVYIINGNIATHDDGSIDVGNSDDMILFYDPTTNTVEHADATRFAELGSEENADEVRNQAVADAKENAIKEITGIIDGVVEVGTQFKTIDADGTEHAYEVLADNGDGTAMITIDGNIPTQLVKGENVNVPVSFEELQKMKDASDQQRLQAAKAQREQMEKERAEQQMQAQTTQAENPAQEDNIQSAPIEDNLDYSDIIREDGKVQMVDVSDKDGNNLFPDAKDVFYIQGNKMRTKFAYIDANGELKTQSFPTGLVKIKTRGEVSVDDYKKYRNMILSAESPAMSESSMIEDNSGTIEANRGGIEVEDNTQPLSEADADNVIAQMESSAEVAPELELTPDNWVVEFGEDGIVSTPIGDVKMGENQVAKLFEKGRSKEFGMIKPTITNPDVIIEVPSHSADGNEERSSSYLFIKTFLGKNGKKVYYFKSVTIKKDGLEISISSHYDRAKRVKEALMKGKLLYRKNDGAQTEQNQPSTSVTTSQEDAAGSSESKDTNISANGNENNESLTFEDGTPIPVDVNGEVDLSQTDAAHAAEWYDNNLGDDADDWLDGEIKKVKKVLEQAKNRKLTGTKPSELIASKKEKEAAVADAQAHYDSAISIRDSLKERRIAKEENTPEGRKNLIEKARRKFARLKSAVKDDAEAVSQLYKDIVGSLLHRLYDGTGIDVTDTIPLTAEEYVASNLGAHSLNYEGTETSKGVKQETGLSREDFAKTQLLAADGKGTTIDDLVHSLWENRPSNLESLDTQDIRNALIGVLTSGIKASEARNYIENLRIAQAENILEEQKKAADNAAFAEENKAESEQQTETAPESEEKTGEDNSDEINDEENENINEHTNENINAPEVPEDATDENPLGLQLSEDKVPFEIEGRKSGETYNINDNEDRQRLINDNKVDDKDILDIDMPKHVHKAIKELCKKMGLKVQFLYMGARSNGWIENGTMYLALDTEKATQFVFGHEMTHAIKQKNPEAYKELVKVAMAVTTRKKFEEDLAKVYQNYYGISGYNNVDDFVEEVVADNLGKFINDFDLAQKFSLRLNHPVLATILHAIQEIKHLLYGDFYKPVDALERIVEKAYVDTAKGEVNSETGEDVSFSLRQKPEPKKKGIGYKVFVLKDGKLYPPMVANPNGAATPVGVWLDADAAPIAGESKTGRPQVKQGGKGTQGGSGKLAYRPGWHLGVVPYAIQFNRKDADGNKTLFPKNFVFAEVEYAADVDYQEEALQEGINPSGKYQHSLAGLKHLPTDGYYMYRTNPNPETDPWVITGAMKVNRILTRAEQAELVKNAGREPQQIQEGDIVTDDVVNSINQEIADAPKFSLKVYHGSGADFTEFDFDHMGEGAGSQAFGWGGYVTSSKKIGKSYATLMDNDPSMAYYRIQHSNGTRFAKKYPTLESFLHGDKQIAMNDKFTEQEKIDYYNEMKKLAEPYHNLYEVDITDDNGSNYLDWDAPLTDKQKNTIIKELRRLKIDFADFKKRGFSFDGSFGGNSYDFLMYALRKTKKWKDVNASRAVSKFLSSLGYTGIKYKAGRNFGGAEEGDTNYVIFKPEDMKITEHTKFSIRLKSAIEETETNPSDAQKESGNYKKGHIKFGGYDYTIENPKGSTRSGKDADGKEWKVTMHDTYGYIRGKFGKDGDHLDMFINDKADLDNWNGDVFVVDQVNPDGSFDEHKVMYGYDSVDDAKKAYLANYSDGWQGLGNITGASKDEFDKWLDTSNRKLKPFADYAKVKFSLKDEKIKSIAEKFGVNEDDVAMYANAVERGSTAEAARARANIKRYLLQANEDKISSFKDIIKYTKPINEALKENFGDLDAMIEERRKQVEAQRNAMEAARKRAQEEEEKRQKHLDELSLIPTDELDKRYMDAIANNDESTAREMLDESARRNGYGDVDSDYQGQGAWAAPSNPQYESDEARRADIENSPDVNLEDIALGYNLQPDDYFDNPRAYMNNTAYGLESAHVIKNALDAIKNGEKDVKVKVYRAVPTSVKEGKLRNGDWVTPSKKYAEMHGDNRLDGKYRIIEDEVPANQLWWDGNDVNEFGFDDGKEYRYKNAKNNRKLNDLITYDNKGNVIPPSKRFNSRKSDIRFSLRDMADGKESGAADMAEDLKSLNTPDEVDDAIKTVIDDMPIGWQMANKKMIHIAQALGENRKTEIAGEEPKFSLKDGTLIKAGTYFSGGGLVEEGLKGIIDPVVAVEYDEKISGVYRNNFGQHIVTADVRDVDPKELVKQIDGEVEYFHASPVCKNYSQAKSNHAEVELDKETAASTAKFINAVKPKVVTIENVKGYKDSEAMKIITDALDANGYTWDADVYNAADYGGYTNRERLIVRAVRDGKLPEKPKKMEHKSGWYEAVADIIPTLTEKKNGVAPWMDIRLKADGIDWRNIDKPLYVMGSAYADGKVPHAFADELLPTLRTKSGDVIVMPDGKVYRAMGRVLARVSGVSDDYKMPFSENLSHTIIGNGIPTQLTEHVIAPLLQNTLRPTTPEDGNTKFSLRGSTPYDKQMEEWMEKNHLEKGAVPMEKPIMKEGENIFDYANRMVEWTRNQNLWKTAPKKTGFQDALAKWKADNGLSPDAYPPVRPHRENYSTEIGYAEDLEEYNKKKEIWKSAPKPKDFDLSVDLEDMNKQLRNIRRAVLNQKNYDQRTVKAVSDLVRKVLNIGWGDGLSRGKVGNLLSAAKNATGANDVKKYLDKAMGILAENYLNRLSTAYDNLINTKGARADQSGVIKMGSLDAKGQAFMSEYKKAINMDDSSLNTYIANIEEDSAKNEDNVEMDDYRLAGIQAAIMYKQQIGGNDADIAELKRQIGELKNKKDATKVDKDLLKSLEKKLFENKFDRITMFENLLNNIQRMVKESKGRAKEFREEITEHKNEILHRANLDLEGVDSTYYDTTTAKKKFVNNDLQRAVFSSTYTFEQFLKFFGKHSANGEGRLYNYFHKLNQDALDEEQLYNEMNRNALDEKTKELFGKEKFMKLVGIDGKGMKEMDVEVTDYSNKKTGKRTIHLKQGQMLYIYLVNKETDGEMKLRAMGITEGDVAAIEENLDPRVKAMGEWLQDEYLPECQRRYQATHTKYFGAPMKEVENYFPLAINNRARNVKEDVNQDSDAMSQLAGTSTGAIVTRRVNVIPLDIENADAFEVAFNHLQEMEEWSAMLPFRQDINTLLSYTHFRNQVQNMSSVAYGSGKTLWDEFKQTAQIAAGTYKPKVNAGMMDSRIAAAMGGIAVAKISGRLWTAIKQSQSATVFLPECDFTRFVKNGVNPYGSWKWAKKNIPDFRKRIENITYGDVKLRQYLDELEKWHDWTKTISKIGMAPNILVDGITCAVGARSVYETEVNRLTKLGYPKEKAEEKAYYKAVAAYNKTQQSSGGMYLSPMQVDRTYVSAALSLFKNANYAYGRMQIEACRGLARTYDFWGGKHKTTLIESMTRQIMEEDGLDENTARVIAKATYNRTFRQSIGRLINFATLVPVSWALYKVLPYLLTGDDDDKKNDMIEEAVLKGFATSLSDNYVVPFASNILNAGLKVEDGKPTFDPEVFRYQNLYINPATSDLANIYSMIGNQKWYSVANKLGMLGVQSLIGFNPETVGALYQAFAEADYDNGNVAKEWQIGILKAISAPEESIRELYMDELGLKSGDIKKIPLAELEKRYAERQINRDNLLSQIGMDADTFNGYVDKYQKSFEKKIKDKMDKLDEYDKKKADEFFDTTSDPKLKDMIAKKRANDANAAADEQIAKEGLNQEKKGKEPSEEAYDAVKMSIDVAEDNAISTYNKVLNKRYAALNDEYNNQTDAMKYIFMSKHPNFKAYKDLKSEYTTYGKKLKELKEKLVSADGYDAKQTILKQIRAERDKFYELQSKVR